MAKRLTTREQVEKFFARYKRPYTNAQVAEKLNAQAAKRGLGTVNEKTVRNVIGTLQTEGLVTAVGVDAETQKVKYKGTAQ